ncbi:MAG: ECF transporter S component [Atopostipes sp.]|nr:ECF transporter S component [Atopostipes sp.]
MIEKRTKKLALIGILAAMAWIVSFFSFPLLPWTPFLKIDFSDILVLLGMYVYGPLSGIAIAAIRSLLSYIVSGGEAGIPIGDTTAFIASCFYTLPIYYLIKNKNINRKRIFLASVSSTTSLTAIMTILNWLVVAPLYMKVMGFDVGPIREYLAISVIPFNLIKGMLVSIIFFSIFYQLKNYLDTLVSKQNHLLRNKE